MGKSFSISSVFIFILLAIANPGPSSERPDENRVLAVAQKMKSAFKNVEDYTCDVEIIYYQEGIEDERYRLKVYFKRKRKIRIDFSQPYRGASVFYNGGDEKATLKPLRFLPGLKFRLSLDNDMVKTPTGQRVDQADMKYFIGFLFKNLNSVQQMEHEFQEDGKRINFLLWALDHVEGKHLERYRIFVSKRNWFPMRLERYNLEGKPIEAAIFKKYAINANLEDKFFRP